jgi:two-component system NarL family response regulator
MREKTAPIRILLADDHPAVREGLAILLNRVRGMRVIAQASNGKDAIAKFQEHLPDVALFDLRMPEADGIEAMAAIRVKHPGACIIVLTSYDDEEDIYRAFAHGARGYLLKESSLEEIVACLERVLAGMPWIPPNISAKLANRLNRHELSPRERDVLTRVAAGKSNKEIAAELSIAESTVKAHVDHILKKLEVRGRTEAVALGLRLGLIRVE